MLCCAKWSNTKYLEIRRLLPHAGRFLPHWRMKLLYHFFHLFSKCMICSKLFNTLLEALWTNTTCGIYKVFSIIRDATRTCSILVVFCPIWLYAFFNKTAMAMESYIKGPILKWNTLWTSNFRNRQFLFEVSALKYSHQHRDL